MFIANTDVSISMNQLLIFSTIKLQVIFSPILHNVILNKMMQI